MKAFAAAIFSVFFLGVFCAAQDLSSSATGPDADQSVAAAARANRQPKIDTQKEADIRRLFAVMGTQATMTKVMADMEVSIKPLLTSSLPPGEYRDRLVQLFFEKFQSKVDTKAMLDLAIPVYDKYLSDTEIKGLTEFYSGPVGQKMVQVLPKLMSECMENGQKWGQEIGRESMVEVLSEHPDLQQALQKSNKSALPQ